MLPFMKIQKLEKEQFSKKGHKFGFNVLNLRYHWDIRVVMSEKQLSTWVFAVEDKV